MSEKPQSERYCKTCGDRHLPPTGSKCPRVSSISPTKLAARFITPILVETQLFLLLVPTIPMSIGRIVIPRTYF